MNRHNNTLFLFCVLFYPMLLFFVSDQCLAQEVENQIYAELLKKYVINGVVNYQGFKREEFKLDKYLEVLEKVKPEQLLRDDQIAFYINAYNAWTIKLILSKYPDLRSIKDMGSLFKTPWEKKIAKIGNELITLDDIEHGILRPRFKDPRIHFAVNCASKGCPPLRSEPYAGERLNRQLDEMASAFINNSARTRLEGDTLYVSKIFKWFSEDFTEGVLSFVLKYAGGDFKRLLEERGEDVRIKYLEYDWSLNDGQVKG